ncbi:transposase [Streptomyces sp. SP18BB07]|uniref:transposase n=1 Tax=Streptomyces sp. SP18BB07 TaxID=3002522 RepID=UPI002E77283D|nr:transposase [Streptomyces sp. SP18BB07]MEE1763547.1 transposase [Streptomyces sp. SP18BB07]
MPAPRTYLLELRARAVRRYRTSEPKRVIRRMVEELCVHHGALRGWIQQAEADAGERDDLLTTEEKEELAQLRREMRELCRANEVLRTASAFRAARPDPAQVRALIIEHLHLKDPLRSGHIPDPGGLSQRGGARIRTWEG